jgi:hypothetical protein
MSIDLPRSEFEDASKDTDAQAGSAFGAFLRSNGPTVGILFSALLIVGCAVVWAVVEGANAALALLVGYSAIASTVGLALLAPAKTTKTQVVEPAPKPVPAADPETSAAWKLVSTFTISDASRLWCNIEPGTAATQESMAWGRALLDAVKQGDLPIVAKSGSPEVMDRERQNPHYMTQVTREALKQWADEKGHTPPFLRE